MLLLLVGLLALTGVVVTSSGGGTQAQARWVITDLGTLGGDDSQATAINDRGQVVGFAYTTAKDKDGHQNWHAFLWTNGRMRDLGTFGGRNSEALAINEHGQVVGWADTKAKGANGEQIAHAFLWENGRMRDLGTLGGQGSSAMDINDHGQIVGKADTRAKDKDGQPTAHAVVWRKGSVIDLGTLGGPGSEAVAVNEHGQVVGSADTKGKIKEFGYIWPVEHAFLWETGRMRDLGIIGGKRSAASDINERGQIVGSLDTGKKDAESKYGDEPIWHAFLWQNGRMRDLTPGGPFSFAGAINGLGQIAGSVTALGENQDSRATVWQNVKRIELGTLGFGSEAVSINARGQASGWSETRDWDKHAVVWTLRP